MREKMSESVQEKLFGMEPEKGRWMLVILGMVINLCLGSIYSWSVFVRTAYYLLHQRPGSDSHR